MFYTLSTLIYIYKNTFNVRALHKQLLEWSCKY